MNNTQFEPYPSTFNKKADPSELSKILKIVNEYKGNFEILEDIISAKTN
jgi:hypothetical protein